jgi:hypothetical protein
VVDRRGELTDGNDIQLRIGNMKQQGYKLEIEPINIVSDLDAYLVDAYMNTQTLIDLGVKNKYGFEVTGEAASSAANRFRIVFKAKPVKVATFSVAPNPVQSKNMNLQLSNQPAGKYQVRLINLLGQSLYSTTFSWSAGTGNQLIKLPAAIAGGSYHVELTRMSDLKKEVVKVLID